MAPTCLWRILQTTVRGQLLLMGCGSCSISMAPCVLCGLGCISRMCVSRAWCCAWSACCGVGDQHRHSTVSGHVMLPIGWRVTRQHIGLPMRTACLRCNTRPGCAHPTQQGVHGWPAGDVVEQAALLQCAACPTCALITMPGSPTLSAVQTAYMLELLLCAPHTASRALYSRAASRASSLTARSSGVASRSTRPRTSSPLTRSLTSSASTRASRAGRLRATSALT